MTTFLKSARHANIVTRNKMMMRLFIAEKEAAFANIKNIPQTTRR